MMKKLLCIFALFMGEAFADEVKVEHYVEVSFPGEIWHNLDDDYYFASNGIYVISSSDSNFKYNSFGYSFGFLVKYKL